MTKKEIKRWTKRNLGVVPTIDRARGRWRFRAVLRRSFRESEAGKPVVVTKYLKLEVRCPTLRGLHVELVDGCRKHPETQIQPRPPERAKLGGNRQQRRTARAAHLRENRHLADAVAACRKLAPDFKLTRIDRAAPTPASPEAREYGWTGSFTLRGKEFDGPETVGSISKQPGHYALLAAQKSLRVLRRMAGAR